MRRQKQLQVQQVMTKAPEPVFTFSQDEIARQRDIEMRLQREKEDAALARKLAEEEELAASAEPTPRAPVLPKVNDGSWYCPVCTYLNNPLHPVCDMCMYTRSKVN
jgi:hypothetical protein